MKIKIYESAYEKLDADQAWYDEMSKTQEEALKMYPVLSPIKENPLPIGKLFRGNQHED